MKKITRNQLRARIGWAEQRQAETGQELHGDAHHDIEQRVEERAGNAAGHRGGEHDIDDAGDQAGGDQPPEEAEEREAVAGKTHQPQHEQSESRSKEQPFQRAEDLERTEEVILLGPEEQAQIIVEADEGEREAAAGELEARQRQIGRGDQRKDGEGQEDEHRRQHHDAAGMAIDPLGETLPPVGFIGDGEVDGHISPEKHRFGIQPISRSAT